MNTKFKNKDLTSNDAKPMLSAGFEIRNRYSNDDTAEVDGQDFFTIKAT